MTKHTIGIPKEVKNGEGRVVLIPDDVRSLTATHNLTVLVENNAGVISGFTDEDYIKAGAKVVGVEELYNQATLIVKVKEPQPEDLQYMDSRHTVFSYLHLAPTPELVKALLAQKITSVALEHVELNGKYPLLNPMSEIAGKIAIQTATYYLYTSNQGRGILLGGVGGTPKGNVTILGAGCAGRSSALLAANMGAHVTVFDKNPEALRLVETLHQNIESRFISSTALEEVLPTTDVLIGAILIPGLNAPKIVTESMVKTMPKGSVIVDISADQGGCVETIKPTTHTNPSYVKHGVIHMGIQNLPGAVPRTSSTVLSGTVMQYVAELAVTDLNGESVLTSYTEMFLSSMCTKDGVLLRT